MLRRLALVTLLLLTSGLTGGPPAPAPLDERIDAIVEGEQVRSALWGIYVQDLHSGRVLYRRNADQALLPASNQKLLTTATALDVLGSAYRYQTTLYFDGRADGAVLRGDLILEGSGDPTFGSRRFEQEDPLRQWAQQLAQLGVTRIEGRIIGDDDAFDDDAYPDGWDVSYVATEGFAPARSGLTYRDNLVAFKIEATAKGRPVAVEAEPPGYFTLHNQATTSARKRGPTPRVDRRVGTETVRLHGTAPRAYSGTLDLPVSDPTAFALFSFARHLRQAGIDVAAALLDVDALPEKPSYDRARPLFVYASPPLAEIVRVINKDSNNLYAEQVFHTFGWGGTAEGGARRVREVLARLGIPSEDLSVRDGSGLSRKDLVTPEALARLLVRMDAHPERAAFLASLPEGGERKTTLQYRLRGVPVRAKTGSLEYARSLSGYVESADGRTLVFVILANNYTVSAYRINQAIDSIVLTLSTTQTG